MFSVDAIAGLSFFIADDLSQLINKLVDKKSANTKIEILNIVFIISSF